MDYDKIKEILKEKLVEKRYIHSLAVADEAKRLAEKYGADTEKAYLAGLVHDITKNMKTEEQLLFFDEFDIILDDIEKNSEKLWHAISGAKYVEKVLGITDKEIISAIRFHTTAKENMTTLEKVLYLADFTSRDRDYEDVDVMRRLVDVSLSDAMEYALNYTINELNEKKSKIHPDTLSAAKEVMKRRK